MEHFDRVFHGRLFNIDRGKTAFESRVLFNVLVVFVQGGRTDRLQLAAGQGRLEHVGRVHGALCRARTDDGMQLVDHQDDLALGALDLFDHSLETLLELTPEAGSGDHRAQIECDYLFPTQDFGHIVISDLLSKTFCDGGLANPCFTDEHGIVLRAA